MSTPLATLGRRLVDKREDYDAKRKVADKAEEDFKDAQDEFWAALEDSSQKTVLLELGEGYGDVQFQRRETTTARVLDAEALAAALEKMGLADAALGPPQARQKVLSEYVRDWLKSGQPLPEGLDFNNRRYVTITRKD